MKRKTSESWEIDVAVLLIFFVRDEQFKQTFAAVKAARPRVLLLYQDGPRKGRTDDIEGVRRCRTIAEDIDWECDVHKLYQEKNYGCDPSEYIAQKWAFSIVDKCIVLEDDDVPCQSFFHFCKELLDHYEHDERINRICGFNNIGIYESCPHEYFFSRTGSPWGWASWKRVIDGWEGDYAFLDDEYTMNLLKKERNSGAFNTELQVAKRNRASGVEHYESILSFNAYLNSRLTIFPKRNMISNVGNSLESTHTLSDLNLMPRRLRELYHSKTYEINFPLRHPRYIVEDKGYAELVYKQMGNGHPWISFKLNLELLYLRIKYGQFKSIYAGIKRRMKTVFNRTSLKY